MVQLYRIELTDEITEYWLESLKELSPNQVRKGFMAYTSDPALCDFVPKPGRIKDKSGYQWSPPPFKPEPNYAIVKCKDCGMPHQATSLGEAILKAKQCDHTQQWPSKV